MNEMMFILDEIGCFFEEIGLAVEEKICMLQDPTSWPRGSSTDEEDENCERDQVEPIGEEEPESGNMEDQKNDEEGCGLDDFNEYLRECARGILFPRGVPESIKKQQEGEEESGESAEKCLTESIEEELKEIMQMVSPKLSEDDKKEISDSLKSKGLSIDISGLPGISVGSSVE